jgi:hypothetical protein
MSQFPRFALIPQRPRKTSHKAFFARCRNMLASGLAALLFLVPLSFSTSAQESSGPKAPFSANGDSFILYRSENGEAVCRPATLAERSGMRGIEGRNLGLHPITHVNRELDSNSGTPSGGTNAVTATNLTIVLVATSQLDSFPDAKAAFIRAAAAWEAQIQSPVTIYVNVDYGPTDFGQPWDAGVLGATSSPSISSAYSTVRSNLITTASTAAETSLYSSLPASAVPTDLGNVSNVSVSSSIARAIGLLPANAASTDTRSSIGFNSTFQYDFDPSNGISSGRTDFEAVATHEIGHALGFVSRAGGTSLTAPTIWDLFRFRTGTTLGSFNTAQRIMTASGLQYFYAGSAEVALSTGGPNGDATGGDGNQSSHWKQASLNGGVYVGIMDPRIPAGVRRPITANDTVALNFLGFNLDNSNPPPPPPPPPAAPTNDNLASAQSLSGCSGSAAGTNVSATKEAGEPNHANNIGGKSVWYRWQSPSSSSVNITTAGSDFDTTLGVYTVNAQGTLALIAQNDDVNTNGGIYTSTVTFNATAGTTYMIAVDGYNDGSGAENGNITLNWSASNCTLPSNPIDGASFFVSQHYQDFLGRTADAGGLQYWSEQITGNSSNAPSPCVQGDTICENVRRISVSAAFFVENEFQRTGGFVYRFYAASYGTRPTYQQFNSDRALVFEGTGLEARKQAFAAAWIQRPEFIAAYPASLNTADSFVDAILLKVLTNSGVDLSSQRASLLNDYVVGGRAQVVRSVADNATFAQAEYNAAFVSMQYFGYLKRNPDDGGYNFWLGILNDRVPNNYRAMVCAFLTSTEYQQRFGTTITRSNNDCSFVGP